MFIILLLKSDGFPPSGPFRDLKMMNVFMLNIIQLFMRKRNYSTTAVKLIPLLSVALLLAILLWYLIDQAYVIIKW